MDSHSDVFTVVWSDGALNELEAIEAYVAKAAPSAARRLVERLRDVAASLSTHPERGRIRRGGRRELTVVEPYLIRYRVSSPYVFILQVRHGARRPLR